MILYCESCDTVHDIPPLKVEIILYGMQCDRAVILQNLEKILASPILEDAYPCLLTYLQDDTDCDAQVLGALRDRRTHTRKGKSS